MTEIIADTLAGPMTVDLQTAPTSVLVMLARGGVEDARRLLLDRTARRIRKRSK